MATPPTAVMFAALLRAEGLVVVEVGDWRTHNRNHKGPWGPVHGVMIHHTVTRGTARTVAICRDGYAELPGPLCHGVIAKDGTVYLVGYGRANHAGSGDDDVLRAVIAEKPVPVDDEANTDGNRYFYGFECENLGDGEDPWPAVQLEAIERASAAVCRHHGWGAGSVIGHREWQPGKPDPVGFGMDEMRARIAERLDDVKPRPPAPPPPVRPPFPGRAAFGPGRTNASIELLGKQLVRKGFGRFYAVGPGPRWGEADRKATAAFQASQAALRGDADGYPGPLTWQLLWA